MMTADMAKALNLLAPLVRKGYEFRPAGKCVIFDKPYAKVPYVMVKSILASNEPCKYVRSQLAGKSSKEAL